MLLASSGIDLILCFENLLFTLFIFARSRSLALAHREFTSYLTAALFEEHLCCFEPPTCRLVPLNREGCESAAVPEGHGRSAAGGAAALAGG